MLADDATLGSKKPALLLCFLVCPLVKSPTDGFCLGGSVNGLLVLTLLSDVRICCTGKLAVGREKFWRLLADELGWEVVKRAARGVAFWAWGRNGSRFGMGIGASSSSLSSLSEESTRRSCGRAVLVSAAVVFEFELDIPGFGEDGAGKGEKEPGARRGVDGAPDGEGIPGGMVPAGSRAGCWHSYAACIRLCMGQ
jgi:hypothetical protein